MNMMPQWAHEEVSGALTYANLHAAMVVAARLFGAEFAPQDALHQLVTSLDLWVAAQELCSEKMLWAQWSVGVDMKYGCCEWCYSMTIGNTAKHIWSSGV